MKKKIILVACSVVLLTLAGCGTESKKESGSLFEQIPAAETAQADAVDEAVPDEKTNDEAPADVITEEQALEAIKEYCFANNPDLEGMIGSDDYTVFFDVSRSDTDEIVVLYRSYTGAEIRYYVDPVSGDVYSTELVPGIIDEEQRTDESFNLRDV